MIFYRKGSSLLSWLTQAQVTWIFIFSIAKLGVIADMDLHFEKHAENDEGEQNEGECDIL